MIFPRTQRPSTVSAPTTRDYWHFVTYGLTELYGKGNEDPNVSGFGYELTFKLPKVSAAPAPWAFDFLEAIGKQVWKGLELGAGHTIKTGPLDGRPGTRETAVLVVRDALVPDSIVTPNGRVELLLLLGIEDVLRQRVLTAYESKQASSGWESSIVAELRNENPNLVTPIRSQEAWGVACGCESRCSLPKNAEAPRHLPRGFVAPAPGLEPGTRRLTAACSTD
jgi:hypothetical protein